MGLTRCPPVKGESRVVCTRMLWEKGHPQCSCCVSSWGLCLEAWFQWKTWIKLLRANPESRASILLQLILRQFRHTKGYHCAKRLLPSLCRV